MNILVWNVRGLNSPSRLEDVKKLVEESRVGIAGLVETKVKEKNTSFILNGVAPNWDSIFNYEHSHLGRI